jgi:NAD+ diphosphatase
MPVSRYGQCTSLSFSPRPSPEPFAPNVSRLPARVAFFGMGIFCREPMAAMSNQEHFSLKQRFGPGGKPVGRSALWFIFRGDRLLIETGQQTAIITLPPGPLGLRPLFTRFFGSYAGSDCFVAEIEAKEELAAGMVSINLRKLFGLVDDDLFTLAGRALQILHWHHEHRFCGRCGTATTGHETELAKSCPACHQVYYPRLSPAVIMSVIDNRRILLARSPRYPQGMYSTLAGFVEPGETLEEAVRREVREETNILVGNVEYVASQPWPFPHSLMIGFTAVYAGGELLVDGEEIEEAAWFSADALPLLPSKISISRLLIDRFIAGQSSTG